ncbi:MAG: O-antigen ligase family protein [Candidatus Entotheonellia bacterium]
MSYSHAQTQRVHLALQVTGFALLTGLLTLIFLSGRSELFVQGMLALSCLLILLKKPHWGVLIILVMWLTNVSPSIMGIRQLTIAYLISPILLIPLAVAIWRDHDIWAWHMPQVKILVAIGALLLISTAWNEFRHPVTLVPGIDNTREILQLFATRFMFLIFFVYFISTPERIELAAWVLLAVVIASALDAVYNLLDPGARRAWSSFGTGRNANRLAFLCLFGTSLLWFYRAHGGRRWLRSLALPLLFPMPALVLASGSRSGFLQLLVFIAFAVKEREGWSVAKRIRSFLVLGFVSLVLLSIVPAANLIRATTFETAAVAPGGASLTNRLKTIGAAVELVASDPIFGIGIGNFRWMHQAYYGSELATHNSYLWALLAGGVGVLGLYLLLFYFTYGMLRDLEEAGPRELLWLSKGLKVSFILLMIFSAFADYWHSDILYAMLGLTLAMTHLAQRAPQRATLVEPRTVFAPIPQRQ